MVAEMMVYDTELTLDEIHGVELWLNAKYGIVPDIGMLKTPPPQKRETYIRC